MTPLSRNSTMISLNYRQALKISGLVFICILITSSWGLHQTQDSYVQAGSRFSTIHLPLTVDSDSLTSIKLDIDAVSFGVSQLSGHTLNKPTSLQFGPDGYLYVLRKAGHFHALEVQRNGKNSYSVTSEVVVPLVKQIANHDDDGTFNSGERNRQATGLVVTGTPSNPVLYINSSDSRVGGLGGATDTGLDTNSGVISRVAWIGNSRTDPAGYWEKVDIVRGLPRSEENHAPNGMALSVTGDTLFTTIGGFTNAGAPSNNFAFITEYALAAAILAVDLRAVEAIPTQVDEQGESYKYDLPTLDDPTRPNVNGIEDPTHPSYDGIDVNDPWGGNDGLNQAKYVPGSPVVLHATGFRNPYDVIITQAGRMYSSDNGANPGWGGHPILEGPQGTCTNQYDPQEPGSSTPGPNDPAVNNMDNLHYVRELSPGQMYYAGHPTPIRGNPAGAGLYSGDGATGVWRDGTNPSFPLPADWPPVPVSEAYPVECDFQNPGESDNSIATFAVSTNGLAEYTASNFAGEMTGDLIGAGYNNNTLYHIDLNETGDQVLNNHPNGNGTGILAENFGSIPLDVIALGDNDPFPGTIWVVDLDSYDVHIFEPADYDGGEIGECTGASDPSVDEDLDGYDNEDEVLNGTSPCSAASIPADNDGDFTSDLADLDDDNDGVNDIVDAFQIDENNGTSNTLPLDYPLLNEDPGSGFFGVGFTGLMINRSDDYLDLYDFDELIPGGTAGLFTVNNVPDGVALAGANNLNYGFQVGVNVGTSSGPYTARVRTLGPFFNGLTPEDDQAQGFFIGTGDQDNYVAIMLHANNGSGGIRVVHEEGGIIQQTSDYPASGILSAINLDLYLSVDPVAQTVQPKYAVDGGKEVYVGLPFTLSGDLLAAVQGTYEIQSGVSSMLAVGIMGTSQGDGGVFDATWDHVEVTADPQPLADLWRTIQTPTNPRQRHENAFVKAGDMYYLMGGRGNRRTYEYDPDANTWTQRTQPPVLAHHYQAVTVGETVYVIGAYEGGFPNETPIANIYEYTPSTDTWIQGALIPEARQRGSAGAVVYNGEVYIVGGSVGGHTGGATFPTMFDKYNPVTDAWTELPDIPRGRDHFHAAVVDDKLYVVGGRAGAIGATIAEVDVYDFTQGTWSTLPAESGNVITERGGTTVAVVGKEIFFIGGESGAQQLAHSEVEVLDTETLTWRSLDNLDTGRHGTQAISDGNHIYIAAGSGETGGGPELSSLEVFERTALSDPGGVVPSTLASSITSHDFGTVPVNTGESQAITLSNTQGNQDIIISDISISGTTEMTATYTFTLPHTLAPTESAQISVDYSPVSSGIVDASLDITHNGNNQAVSISLAGEGTETFTFLTQPDTVQFYVAEVGGSSWDRQVRLATNSSQAVTITGVQLTGTNSGEFATSFVAPATIESGQTVDVGVTFEPTSEGIKAAQLEIAYNQSGSPAVIPLTGIAQNVQTGNVLYRVNAGGPALTSQDGLRVWTEDQTASLLRIDPNAWIGTPSPYIDAVGDSDTTRATLDFITKNASVATGTPSDLFKTERFGSNTQPNQTWSFPIEAGTEVEIRLYLAEIYLSAANNDSEGPRVFDVAVNGSVPAVFDNINIFDEVGHDVGVMKSFYTVSNGAINLEIIQDGGNALPAIKGIEIIESSTLAYTFGAGWNLVGLPLISAEDNYSVLFSDLNPSQVPYRWDGTQYLMEQTLGNGEGYFIHVGQGGLYAFEGASLDNLEVQLDQGWNLIAGPSCSVLKEDINDPNSILIPESLHLFNNGYFPADQLSVGAGYWVEATTSGTITLSCSGTPGKNPQGYTLNANESFGTVQITDAASGVQTLYFGGTLENASEARAYILPPLPPEGGFDVRFTNGARLTEENIGRMVLQSDHYPLTLRLTRLSENAQAIELLQLDGNQQVGSTTLTLDESVTITNTDVDGLEITQSTSVENGPDDLPSTFNLIGNYPNPFNPTTTVVFDLPEQAEIEINVYDMMGRKVISLPAKSHTAGRRQVAIDAQALASGIYLYHVVAKMGTRTEVQVGRMAFVK